MKLFKGIVLILYLTPMVGYGQDPDIENEVSPSILEEQLISISMKLFDAICFDSNSLFQNPNLDRLADEEYYSKNFLNDTFQISIQDNSYPCVEFAFKDTVIVMPFLLEDMKNFAISIDKGQIQSIAPMRYHHGSELRKPLFWIKWEDAQKVLFKNDAKLISLLVFDSSKVKLDRSYLKEKSKGAFYFDSTSYQIKDLIIMGIKRLVINDYNSMVPRIYEDSLFLKPLYQNVFDKVEKSILKEFSEEDSFEFSSLDFQLALRPHYSLFELTQTYSEVMEDGYPGMLDIIITQNIFLKQEDFFPLLPECLKLLMEEVYVE